MRVLSLSYYSVKRFCRSRRLMAALLGLPFIIALIRVIFIKSSVVHVAADICPIVCGLAAVVVVYIQHSVDEASGFLDGIRGCPFSTRALIASRVAAWGAIFIAQMAVFLLVLAARL